MFHKSPIGLSYTFCVLIRLLFAIFVVRSTDYARYSMLFFGALLFLALVTDDNHSGADASQYRQLQRLHALHYAIILGLLYYEKFTWAFYVSMADIAVGLFIRDRLKKGIAVF
jgi:hypothetical protein